MGKPTFIAIDFETADHGRDSACAVGIVKVQGTRIIHEESRLIRPFRWIFYFSYLHGITCMPVDRRPGNSHLACLDSSRVEYTTPLS